MSLFHFVTVPLSQPLRFPNWDILGGVFLLQGTLFYSARGITAVDGSSADFAAGVVGLILCIALSALYMRLHLCSLLLGVFKFQRYRQNIVTKFPFAAWRYFVPQGRWGPQFIRLSLGSLRSSAATSTRDDKVDLLLSMAPVLCSMVAQALMGLDLHESSSACSGVFFVLSALRVGVMLLHVVYFSRGRSRGLAAANVMQHASQSALLMAFACLMLEDATTKTDNDGASLNAIHVFAYVVSVTSAVRMVLLTLTFVWETQESVSALESVVNNLPMSLSCNQKNRRDSKIVSAGQLKILIYEICNHQRARHKLLRPSLHSRSQ